MCAHVCAAGAKWCLAAIRKYGISFRNQLIRLVSVLTLVSKKIAKLAMEASGSQSPRGAGDAGKRARHGYNTAQKQTVEMCFGAGMGHRAILAKYPEMGVRARWVEVGLSEAPNQRRAGKGKGAGEQAHLKDAGYCRKRSAVYGGKSEGIVRRRGIRIQYAKDRNADGLNGGSG